MSKKFSKSDKLYYNKNMRYLLKICYDGRRYSGWQKQNNAKSIEATIESAMSLVLGNNVDIVASGRTDAGVSALSQCAHFDCDKKLDESFVGHINSLLPQDIRVLGIEKVGDNFHARFDVKQKTYVYNFYTSKISLPVYDATYTQVKTLIDEDKFRKNMNMLIGTHDFTSFCASDTQVKDKTRTIYDAQLFKDGSSFSFKITGDGFLYNMVRIIVGTLIDIASGKIDLSILDIINKKDRSFAGKTLASGGLKLYDVKY